MALVYKDIAIDVNPGKAPQTIHVSQYDINRQFNVSLTDDGIPLTIPQGTTAVVEGSIGRYSFRENATVSNNVVTFTLSEAMTANKGKVWTKIKLTEQGHPLSTCAFWLDVDRAGVEAGNVIGAVGFDQQLKDGVAEYMDAKHLDDVAFLPMGLVPTSTDLDTLTASGHYLIAGSSNFQYEHNPLPAGHTGVLLVYKESANYGTQVMHDTRPGGKLTYRRSRSNQADFADREWTLLYPEFAFNPSATPFSVITDMPSMSVYRGAPDKFTLGDNFGWTLKARVTYRIAKFGNLILVSSPASDETYVGTYSDLGVDSWNKFATDDVYESIQPDAVQIYTDFKFIEGKVFSGDNLIDKPADINLQATEKMPCLGNTDYFNRFRNYTYNGTTVVFFDKTGQIIGHKWQADFTEYSYTTPDGTQEFDGTYLPMLKFTTPENAAFFAFNWSMTEANKKYFCVSNVPLFLIGFSQPSIQIKEHSPLLAKKDKTLCVIGPSGVMIDRLYRPAAGDYISGFQEHLRPYYKDVVSYGYSSAAYAVGATESPSIYEYITQGVGSLPAKDFTNIDEVLFIQSGSALSTLQVGDAGGLSAETVDTSTMIGAIRGIVQYILAQNPRCKIYIASFYKYNNSIANPGKVHVMHDAAKNLCDALGLTYVDLWSNVPFNYSNYSADNLVYTYDGGHANSFGNKALADVIKPRLLSESGV